MSVYAHSPFKAKAAARSVVHLLKRPVAVTMMLGQYTGYQRQDAQLRQERQGRRQGARMQRVLIAASALIVKGVAIYCRTVFGVVV